MSEMEHIGVVVIGRNEGDRLKRCLRSIDERISRVVYVDSGSSDDSVEFARSFNVEVVELDTSVPFTTARARNAGYARLKEISEELSLVQFVDGDCAFEPGWFDAALGFMNENGTCSAICGRLIERHPEQSVYNTLCQIEWDRPIGRVDACGGIAMYRTSAFDEAGGFDPKMIAGEEPELCFRIRRAGGEIQSIAQDMAKHDAAMTRFAQYWKRAKRAGYAYAQSAYMHGGAEERYKVHQVRSGLCWGLVFPIVAILLAYWTFGVSIVLFVALLFVQAWRIRRNEIQAGRNPSDASLLARFIIIAKFAQAQGVLLFHWRRVTGKQATLIEYKGVKDG